MFFPEGIWTLLLAEVFAVFFLCVKLGVTPRQLMRMRKETGKLSDE